MHRIYLRRFTIIIVALLLSSCASLSDSPGEEEHTQSSIQITESESTKRADFEFFTQEVQGTKGLKSNAVVSVRNDWGDIRIRNHDQANLIVTTAVQLIGDDRPQRPTIDLQETSTAVSVEIIFPDALIEPRNGRVDLVVFVPRTVELHTRVKDGYTEIKKTSNTIFATSDSGDLMVVNDGPIDIASRSGSIQIRPVHSHWKTVRAESESGKIVAFLPASDNLNIEVTGSDDVRSEIDLAQVDERMFSSSLGDGSDRVHLSSQSTIELYNVIEP